MDSTSRIVGATASRRTCIESRRPAGMNAWTLRHMEWVRKLRFEHHAQNLTILDYITEVEHAAERIGRLERGIDEAVQTAPEPMRSTSRGMEEPGSSRAHTLRRKSAMSLTRRPPTPTMPARSV